MVSLPKFFLRLGNNVPTTELSSVELGIGMLSACMPVCKPLYNCIFYGKVTANTPGHQPRGTTSDVRMGTIAIGRPGRYREVEERAEDDAERLCTSSRLGLSTNVQGLKTHGFENREGIMVTREFKTLSMG